MEPILREPQFVHLDVRPAARSIAIEDLLRQLRSGQIRIPPFQRPLRWKDEDRIRLFDSIYRGFPIGTFLFWQRRAEAARLRVGRLEIEASARTDALWVVDGQQRLVSLADALLAEPSGRSIRFDLEERKFLYGTEAQNPPPRFLPLAELETTRLLRWARHHLSPEVSDYEAAAFDLGKRVREFQVPAYIVETEDEEVVRQIFDRANSTGRALSGAEVFDALHSSKGSSPQRSLRDIAESLRDVGFGTLSTEEVLLALLAVRGKDPAKGFRQIEASEAPEAMAETETALRSALRFLREDARLPHRALLPYSQPLMPLAFFFHQFPAPNPRSRTLLARWLWRGSIQGTFRGETPTLRRMLGAIKAERADLAACSLLRELGAANEAPPSSLSRFNQKHAQSRLQMAALAARGPRSLDPKRESAIDLGEICEQRGGPAIRLVPPGDPPEADGLAGRILHPNMSWRDLHRRLGEIPDEQILHSHVISLSAQAALRNGNVPDFLRIRESDLRSYIEQFFQQMAAWNPADLDRPALESLVLPDEE